MLPSQLTSTVAVACGVASVALCFLSPAFCSFRGTLAPLPSGPLLPHPRCPFCSLPGSCVPWLWLGCGCLGPAQQGRLEAGRARCLRGCSVCSLPLALPSAECPPAGRTCLGSSSSPQDLLLKFRGENKFSPRSQ